MDKISNDSTPFGSSKALTNSGIIQPDRSKSTIWGFFLVVAGIILEAGGLLGWGGDRWPDVLISVGAGSLLAGFALILEPRLVRDVGLAASSATAEIAEDKATEVAAQIADSRTRNLDERLTRVEGIAEIQDKILMQRRGEAQEMADRLREVPEYDHVNDVLVDAISKDLFEDLWLRCGPEKDVLLKFERLGPASGSVEYPKPRFFVTLGRTTVRQLLPEGVYEDPSAFVDDVCSAEWWNSESFETLYNKFVDACSRSNQSPRNIDFNLAFNSLADSYLIMIDSRSSHENDPLHLSGPLTMLINEEWAITNVGFGAHALEGILSDHKYETWPLDTNGRTVACPEGYKVALWQDALYFAERFLHRLA